MSEDPYYKKCCLTGETKGKIDWHHAWKYGKSQINEKWAIMPVSYCKHSPYGDKDSVHNCKETAEKVQFLSLERATKEDLNKYPKKNWDQIYKYLKNRHDPENLRSRYRENQKSLL